MKTKQLLKRFVYAVLIAAVISAGRDYQYIHWVEDLPIKDFLLVFAGITLTLFLFKWLGTRELGWMSLAICSLWLVSLLVFLWPEFHFALTTRYRQTDSGKEALFAGRNVLVVAPHEDDELNIAGGVIEEYLRYGSQVTLLFTTNGDYLGKGEQRLKEARRVAGMLGVPEDHLIFLGYGDQLEADGVHIYNAPEDLALVSQAGLSETYGLPDHPAFRDGISYTRRHLYEDLRDAVLQLRPDVIFCSSYEDHSDHCAAALLLEEAMAEILSTVPDYRPLLLETPCYLTAYYAPDDFFSENIPSTLNPFGGPFYATAPVLEWDARLRLPVSTDTLARSLFGSSTFWQLRRYKSQGAVQNAENIISGDRVFWQRDTSSLSYTAQVTVSSGDGEKLNDFKLLDTAALWSDSPWEGTWVPEPGDTERTVQLLLPQEAALTELRLYDNPSPEDNVLNVLVRLDSGETLETGALNPNGSATVVQLSGRPVRRIELQLTDTEGAQAGLTEAELYEGRQDWGTDFLKLQNQNGDFAYDYYIDPSGLESFTLYTPSGALPEGLTVRCDNGACSASLKGGAVTVNCPLGEHCTVTVSTPDGALSDSVFFSNPGAIRSEGRNADIFFYFNVYQEMTRSVYYRLAHGAYSLLRYGSLDP